MKNKGAVKQMKINFEIPPITYSSLVEDVCPGDMFLYRNGSGKATYAVKTENEMEGWIVAFNLDYNSTVTLMPNTRVDVVTGAEIIF
jgi:hypothetical protein